MLLEYGPVIKALLYLYRAVRQQNVEEALKFLRGIVVSTESTGLVWLLVFKGLTLTLFAIF